ncbi:filamentous haemagglutinin family protein [Pseudomonas sp. Irchel s3b2]|uniref:filamentous haemagglutinin family protein n=1 Tax=Pseudomonas sp. Irchel s3b2 TaxID=2009073 RepID=UPI000BA49F58|nr:filamentous haemagglutinin family protein [Pseudomonas sp. Irchel s3b2]
MPRGKTTPDLNVTVRSMEHPLLRLKPLAQAIALLMIAGSAEAATAFSSSWFAAKGAALNSGAARPGSAVPGSPPPLAQQQRVNQQLQRSLNNLNNTVAAIAAQQAAQAAGRQFALGQPQSVPNGMGDGGLKIDENPLTRGWTNANKPLPSHSGGKTTVHIEQTADKAILNWETFNVGRDTTVEFGQQASWAVLNRVNDPNARASVIAGQINAPGTVMVVNRNGIVFSGSSQVNVRNLVAAAATISDDQFSKNGLYVDQDGTQPTFSDAFGKVEVQRGAVLQTLPAGSSTQSGGYALLLGSEVRNDGTLVTPEGQTTLAAGDSFYIRRGAGTEGNQQSTTRGNEVASTFKAGSQAGTVVNSGIIQAATGDITLTGHQVQQNGVLVASTSVDTRGTIHLLNAASDATGSVTLGQGSVSTILLEQGALALDSQRQAAINNLNGVLPNNATGRFDNLSKVSDRTDQSRVEVVSGGTVDFQSGSITLATGGQVAVSAGKRSLVRDGAIIDVSGAVGVKVAMKSNSIKVNIQGNEQRDASGNREGGALNSTDVWVDVRELVHVAAGVNGYATDRWYTAGGLLEVGGYLGTRNHSIGEWMAQGGSLTFAGNDLVTQQGSQINLSGGTLDVQGGYVQQSWLKGANGRLYEVSRAPGDLLYTGVYKGYEDHSERWGQTDYFYNPLIAPRQRYENGYSVGRDAGQLVVATNNSVLEGELVGKTFQGDRQTQAPAAGLDGYQQSQNSAARNAILAIGSYVPRYLQSAGTLNYQLGAVLDKVTLSDEQGPDSESIDLNDAVTADREGSLSLNSRLLNDFELGAIKVAAKDRIVVDGALQVTPGGDITLYGPRIDVNADLTARSGSIRVGNVLNQLNLSKIEDTLLSAPTGSRAAVVITKGIHLDASGLWRNQSLSEVDSDGVAYRAGGTVSLRSSDDLLLQQGSLIDVSSGATLLSNNKLLGGRGGDITLAANANSAGSSGQLLIGAELLGYGVDGAGTLDVQAGKVQIGRPLATVDDSMLVLAADFFTKGFGQYRIAGNQGLTVLAGTQVDVTRPVYRLRPDVQGNGSLSTGQLLEVWTPEQYQEDPIKGVLTQRGGANLSLNAGTLLSPLADRSNVSLTIEDGAVLSVDPGQALNLASIGQLTVNGQLNAWGGLVNLSQINPVIIDAGLDEAAHQRSIRVGSSGLIDVSARAVTAIDFQGRRYGRVGAGGSIVIGSEINTDQGTAKAPDLFVVLEQGSRLLANGAQAQLDIRDEGARSIAGAGGKIALSSNNGLIIHGQFSAASGGAGAAGGSLSVALESGLYLDGTIDNSVLAPRELILSQGPSAAADPSAPLAYGQGQLDVQRIITGGFDNLSLLSNGILSFDGDVNLSLKQSLSLYAGSLALAENAASNSRVSLHAPYLRLAGATARGTDVATRPTVKGGLSTQDSQAQLQLSADLMEVRDEVTFGAHGSLEQNQGPDVLVDRRGFAQATLRSEGDLRFLGATALNAGGVTLLRSNADLDLLAAQLYPVTGANARVQTTTESTLTIGRTTDTVPTVPYSAFGQLTFDGGIIQQGGVVRAPFGLLTFGIDQDVLQNLSFLPGSLTSVSGEDLLMPYGGTIDGLTYQYNGKTVELTGVGGSANYSILTMGISLKSPRIEVQPDAVLDLSGGGELTGAGFISGRGGSTDARYNPLVQNGVDGRFTLPGLSTNPVYAIVPGNASAYAPLAGESGVEDPVIGQRITLDAGVPGLPAGTYTLMPASYALLPGAFRVELNGLASAGALSKSLAMRNGSWATSGRLSIANTGIADPLSSQLIVTSGDVLRRYSQYNETGYAAFAKADAALKGVPRPMIEADGKTLLLGFVEGASADPSQTFSFKGQADFTPGKDGLGGAVGVINNSNLEVLAVGQAATQGFDGSSIYASELNALKAPRLAIGALPGVQYGQGGNLVSFNARLQNIYLRQGATLRAGEVFLTTGTKNVDGIVIEQGASINTLGQGKAPYDSRSGFIYDPGQYALLAVSNGWLDVLPPTSTGPLDFDGPSPVRIGLCTSLACTGTTELYSEGSITVATDNTFSLDDSVRFGTRNLILAVGGVNIGSAQALAAAQLRNALPQGLTLNQQVLDRLLRGDASKGAPALESLVLNARDSVNFYDSVELNTFDQNGQSRLQRLVLGTPAIYGYGAASDRATIHTGTLVWNGTTTSPAAPIANGAGTGSGLLDILVDTLEFGYGPSSQANNNDRQRLALGFNQVNLTATQRITANHTGGLSVYQAQGKYVVGSGFTYSGGNLQVNTPLWTGEAGSINRIKAGGAITVSGIAGLGAGAVDASALGAELALEGQNLYVDSTFQLPSGKLTLASSGGLTLGDAAQLDLAGRKLMFNDVVKYSWGGDLILKSEVGNIRQAAGSIIDLSARNNNAGQLSAYAVNAAAGLVDLQGQILGSASGDYNAGGTLVPYAAGGVDIRAQSVGDFAALNQRLNRDQVFGSRSFQLKRGDLVIGDELKANEINVSVDNGSLTVAGTVDASGRQVGSIRLAGKTGLTLASSAVLDAHGTQLRVDSYGKIIDSPNRASVELSAQDGPLVLASGARIDLRHGTDAASGTGPGQNDGRMRGTLELNARRLGGAIAGDIDVDARGPLTIQGARSIVLNAVQRYSDAPPGTGVGADGKPFQEINQGYLKKKHDDSTKFINATRNNSTLLNGKLAGLNNATYADAFHLRPGVQIVSATPDGNMVISGDIDLSGYRYASLNPHSQQTGVYGSGEPGSLVIRAGGNLDVFGSVTDGFMPPAPAVAADRSDGNGWLLIPGKQPFGADLVVPRSGVELADGTQYPAGSVLNYDLPFQAMTISAGTLLPNALELGTELNLAAGTLLGAAVRDSNGNVLYAAGTILKEAVTLPPKTRLDAGSRFNVAVAVEPGVWPKGVALPDTGLVQSGVNVLPVGGLIPAETDVKLADGTSLIELRAKENGQQGSNWAVATMLPDGSLSWSMRMVAGADTQAADTRLTRVDGREGNLRLADGHYMAKRELIGGVTPGTGLVWGADNYLGYPEGTPILPEELFWCEVFPGSCLPAPPKTVLVWAPDNYLQYPEGTPILPEELFWCEVFPDSCVAVVVPEEPAPGPTTKVTPQTQLFSVLRTGTGDLDLLSAGDFSMQSLFGVYTAGTQSASLASGGSDPYQQARGHGANGVLGADASAYEFLTLGANYKAWYPEQGGNLRLSAGGQLQGDTLGRKNDEAGTRPQFGSAAVGNWLWRQGMGNGSDIPTAWWINYGTFVAQPSGDPALVGFTGIGTLGGGNLDVNAAGDAGLLAYTGSTNHSIIQRSQGITLAVGGTGRVASDGSLVLTGGGDMQVHIGGRLNPSAPALAAANGSTADLKGTLVNLRGALQLQAGAVGALDLRYGSYSPFQDPKESRAYDAYTSTLASAQGGMTVVAGDTGVQLNSRGDLVLDGVGDPGRLEMKNSTGYTDASGTHQNGGGYSGFSLWTPNTAIDLFSAGGNLTPFLKTEANPSQNTPRTGGRMFYPSILRAVAANGSLYYGASATGRSQDSSTYSLMTAPSANAELQLIAGDSIYAGGYAVTQSGADPARIPTPFNPVFVGINSFGGNSYSNFSADVYKRDFNSFPLFTFGANIFTNMDWPERQPVRFYAINGDIVGLRTGEILRYPDSGNEVRYEGSGPLRVMAGRDIVNSGVPLTTTTGVPAEISGNADGRSTGNLIVHSRADDISLVSAGRDIRLSTFNVAGPGLLEVSAGRNLYGAGSGVGNVYQEGGFNSIGNVDARSTVNDGGASIALVVGAGAQGPNYQGLLSRYLGQGALKNYSAELAQWLTERFGLIGNDDQVAAWFAALPAEQQRVFARKIYFAELKAGGREYNEVGGVREGSYLRGREAIAALFPEKDVAGNTINYDGDVTLYGGAGIHTDFGGDIQVLTPGGRQVYGIEGAAPPSTAGVITQGSGDIQLYSRDSILLGQSRIMTTFGGSIFGWSAQGDINAGRGSKTTVVYTPPKRVYDTWGNVTLSPSVPSTGAGIATLNPIPEVAPGDIDLIAPLGTIDAGEAGIRVSGNVNIAALTVVNAANIQTQGKSTGVPMTASVNTGAITSASSAASSATQAAEDVARQQQAASRQNQASVFTVQVLSFGSEQLAPTRDGASRAPEAGYNPNSPVQVLGAGALDESARQRLTEEERGSLTL